MTTKKDKYMLDELYEIYVMDGCSGCRHVLALAKMRRIPHIIKSINNEEELLELKTKVNGNIFVPVIFHNGTNIGHLVEFKQHLDNSEKYYK